MPLTVSQTEQIQDKKVGRNDLCPCGSGKKYKKCCMQKRSYSPSTKSSQMGHVGDWLSEQDWYRAMLTNYIKVLFGEEPAMEEDEMIVVTETVIFEHKYKGYTPFEHFLRGAELTPQERDLYESWRDNTLFSFFEVLDIEKGTSITLEDLYTGERYVALERMATYGVEPGYIMPVRLLPCNENWMLTGAIGTIYPQSMKRTVNKMVDSGADSMTQLEYTHMMLTKNKMDSKPNFTKDYETMSHDELRELLKYRLSERGYESRLKEIETEVSAKKSNIQKCISILSGASYAHADMQDLVSIFMCLNNSHPSRSSLSMSIGEEEHKLRDEAMDLVTNEKIPETLSKEEREKKVKGYIDAWLDKKNKKYGNKTPREVILEERRSLGNNDKTIEIAPEFYSFESIDPDAYNQAIRDMQNKDFIPALNLFAEYAENPYLLPEPFRWYNNVGVCLCYLGEEELGKKYVEQAITLEQTYEAAKKNLETLFSQRNSEADIEIERGRRDVLSVAMEGFFPKDCSPFARTDIVEDACAFLTYIQNNEVKRKQKRWHYTSPCGWIIEKDAAQINELLVTPTEADEVTEKTKKAHDNGSTLLYPKVHVLYLLMEKAGYIEAKGQSVQCTEDGEEFLSWPSRDKWTGLFYTWLEELDWKKVVFSTSKEFSSFANYYNNVISTFLLTVLSSEKKVQLKELVEKTYMKYSNELKSIESEEKKAYLLLHFIAVERLIMLYLTWFGLIDVVDVSKLDKENPQLDKYLNYSLRATKLGKCVYKHITQEMKDVIPKEIRNHTFTQ